MGIDSRQSGEASSRSFLRADIGNGSAIGLPTFEAEAKMRVLVTGHRGYIGSVLTGVLRNHRYEVFGLDCDLYRGCDFGRVSEVIPSFDFDLREVEFTDLLSFDAVVHLAGLPEGLSPPRCQSLIQEVNVEATVRLAECAKKATVSRFLFASSCAVYGRGVDVLYEESDPKPMTPYGASKLLCEQELMRLASPRFRTLLLRNATVYGVSPRLRLDLCVNDFVGSAVTRGRVHMQTAGRAWRPLIHVEDLARVYAGLIAVPDDSFREPIINIVDPHGNFRIIDVGDAVAEEVPGCTNTPASDVFDARSYHVDGSRLQSVLPLFKFRWSLGRGIRQLRMAMTAAGLTLGDWRSDRFRRAPRLESLIEHGEPLKKTTPRSVSA